MNLTVDASDRRFLQLTSALFLHLRSIGSARYHRRCWCVGRIDVVVVVAVKEAEIGDVPNSTGDGDESAASFTKGHEQ